VPDATSKQDAQGNAVWNYTYVDGGAFINDAGSNKWWTLEHQELTAGDWVGNPVFLYGSSLPYFSATHAQMLNNDILIAPLGVWTAPVDAEIQVGGSVSFRGKSGTNTASADYVLAIYRAADDSWETLDSAVFVPNGGSSAVTFRATRRGHFGDAYPSRAIDDIVRIPQR
jgi:hypothetical protein